MDFASGDFNNDGNMDVIVGDQVDNLYIFLGDGQGNFTTHTITTDAPGTRTRCKDAADLNYDGNVDFIYGENADGYIYVYYGLGVSGYNQSIVLEDDVILTVVGTSDNLEAKSWQDWVGTCDTWAIRWKLV